MHIHDATVLLISLAGLLSLALAALALGALRRTGSRKLGFVAAAFGLFAVKAALTAYSVATGFIGHEDLELVGAFFDVLVVLLLVAPFVGPRRAVP